MIHVFVCVRYHKHNKLKCEKKGDRIPAPRRRGESEGGLERRPSDERVSGQRCRTTATSTTSTRSLQAPREPESPDPACAARATPDGTRDAPELARAEGERSPGADASALQGHTPHVRDGAAYTVYTVVTRRLRAAGGDARESA